MILFDLDAVLREPDSPEEEQPEPFQEHLAASKVFAEVRPIQRQLAGMANSAELLRQLSEIQLVLPPLEAFHAKMKELAQLLEPMHDFQNGLRQVPPLETLDHELVQFTAACSASFKHLATSLEPAAALQDRLAQLAIKLEPAKTLRHEFVVLAQSFERSSRS